MSTIPNWSSNSLTTTNPEIIAKLKELDAAGDEDLLDAFVPMPKILGEVRTGSAKDADGNIVNKWLDGPNDECLPISDEQLAAWRKEYGHDNWYDWHVANWGTKWEADGTVYEFNADSATVLFSTAWSPPITWLEKVIAQHPQGVTTLAYAEGGMCFYGAITYVDGELADQHEANDFWRETEEEFDDIMDALTDECAAHLERYGLGTGG